MNGTLKLTGRIGMRPWSVTLPLGQAAQGRGISKLWARRKIADAEVARTLGKTTQQAADARILSLALAHHLVTRLTSLVAVDDTPARPEGARLTRAEVPLNLPAGWDFDKVFGPSATKRASNANALSPQYAGVRQTSGPIVREPSGNQVLLPQTATEAELKMLAGLLLLLLAGGITFLARARRAA